MALVRFAQRQSVRRRRLGRVAVVSLVSIESWGSLFSLSLSDCLLILLLALLRFASLIPPQNVSRLPPPSLSLVPKTSIVVRGESNSRAEEGLLLINADRFSNDSLAVSLSGNGNRREEIAYYMRMHRAVSPHIVHCYKPKRAFGISLCGSGAGHHHCLRLPIAHPSLCVSRRRRSRTSSSKSDAAENEEWSLALQSVSAQMILDG